MKPKHVLKPDYPSRIARFKQKDRLRKYKKLTGIDITLEQLEELESKNNGKCWICGGVNNGRQKNLHMDHDHNTGKVRGMLCHKCNVVLGLVNDNPKILNTMIQYLKGR